MTTIYYWQNAKEKSSGNFEIFYLTNLIRPGLGFILKENIPTTLQLITITLCTDIHNAQRMNPDDFDDPLILHLDPPPSKCSHIL